MSPRNQYSAYRAARANTLSSGPPISLLNNANLHNSAHYLYSNQVPVSDSYPGLPDVAREDSGIAIAMSSSPSDTRFPPIETQRQQAISAPLAGELGQESQQSEQIGGVTNIVGIENNFPTAGSGSVSVQQQPQQQKRWSLTPIMPTTPEVAAHITGRRLTPPAIPIGGTVSHSPISGRRPSMSSYVDVVEAASRLKRTHSYQGGSHAGASIHRDASTTPVTQGGQTDEGDAVPGSGRQSESEPEPVLRIGRYTYVRSDAGDHEYRASLIRGDGSRRYTTLPLSHGERSFSGYTRRSVLLPSKPRSMGPYGFSLIHESLFVLVVCLSQALMLAGIAQALVPAQIMGQTFPDTVTGSLAWFTASYGLTSGTFVLPAGRLGDLFGHRRIFILGFFWFALWSLLAGFSSVIQHANGGTNPHRGTIFFIVCRAMQGIGPAMLVPNGQAMLGRAYPPGPRKNIVMSLFGASAPIGFVAGAAMSSLFAVYASWPWAFWTLAAVCVALAAVSMLVLLADPAKEHEGFTDVGDDDDDDDDDEDDDGVVTNKPKKLKRESLWVRLDATGMVLGVSGLALVNFAFNQAPIVGWSTPYTYFLLILGVFFLVAFLYVEAMHAAHPLVPMAAMCSTTNFVLACTAAGWGCFSVWLYYAVQMMEKLRGWSPLHTSAAFAPAPVTGLAASLLTGLLFSRGVKPHWVILISMFAFFIGSLLFATSAPQQLYWFNPFWSILIMPFGMDMSNPAAIILLSNSVDRKHQGIAASLVVTFVNYAISLALGIAGSVEVGAADPDNLLAGYRGAQYFGLGLGGLGVLFATAFLCQSYLRTPSTSRSGQKG